MKLIEFPEQTIVIAKNQPEYMPLPAFVDKDPDYNASRITCCWQLTFKERLKLLFTGLIWHSVLTFNSSLQPQLLQVNKPDYIKPVNSWPMDTSETIILCHQAYCEAAGIEPDALRLNVVFQRWWFDMISEYQIEPNDVKLIVKGRLRANRGRSDASFHSSIQLSRMIRRDDTRAVIYEELLTIKSAMRKRSIDPARAAALRATGRSDQPTPQNIIPIKTQTANALEQVASELRKNA